MRKTGSKKKKSKSKHKTRDSSASHPSLKQVKLLLDSYQSGEFEKSEALARNLTQAFPQYPMGWKILGALLLHRGQYFEAITANEQVTELSHGDAEAHINLGIAQRALGDLKLAEKHYRLALSIKPDLAAAHYNLANALYSMGNLVEAKSGYRNAIALKPDYVAAHINLGVTLHDMGELWLAEASYSEAITLNANDPDVYNNLGNSQKDLGKLNDAEASYAKAIAIKPDFAEAHNNLGVALKAMNRRQEAEARFSLALALKPRFYEAYRNLAGVRKFQVGDECFAQMRMLHRDKDTPAEHHTQICFALAKAHEDVLEFSTAFEYYKEGNTLRKELLSYDISQDRDLFSTLKLSYQHIAPHTLTLNDVSSEIRPIFIVGMPRSGTTLVEQIISSHSQVSGAGELPFLSKFGQGLATATDAVGKNELLILREKYLSALQRYSQGNSIITDKMPHNFIYLSLVAAAFPDAKIVHVEREPAAVCWANYETYFPSRSFGYSYNLDDVAAYHGLYKNLMEHWNRILGERIYHLNYELLTLHQEDQIRKLVEYLALGWEEACLTPEENSRSVLTASNLQVREKIYAGSSERWRKYHPYLGGAFDGLSAIAR